MECLLIVKGTQSIGIKPACDDLENRSISCFFLFITAACYSTNNTVCYNVSGDKNKDVKLVCNDK